MSTLPSDEDHFFSEIRTGSQVFFVITETNTKKESLYYSQEPEFYNEPYSSDELG